MSSQSLPQIRRRQPSLRTATVLLAASLTLLPACGGGGGVGSTPSPPAPPPANQQPLADAAAAQTVTPGATVILDAGASSDSDGSISAWSWTQSDGPDVELDAPDRPQASFVAADYATTTTLSFTVTVTDNDGATATASVNVTVEIAAARETVSLSGILAPPPGQAIDGDTNDPNNTLRSNDDPAAPQPLANPSTLGGYVNEAGAGAEGRSRVAGDPEDFFAVELLAGQRINLLVADFRDADADLYLYDAGGTLVDFSIATGEIEEITVPESGSYLVNVSIFSGATNYTLAIGVPLGTAGAPARGVVVPWEAVVETSAEDSGQDAARELAERIGARPVAGGRERDRLLALEARAGQRTLQRRLGRALPKRQAIRDPALRAQWETLVAIKQLKRQPGIVAAEPNYRVFPTAVVNDPAYDFQWHYPLINLPGAWDSSTGDPGVIVAVIDTGILSGHPDLRGQLVPGYDFVRNPIEAGDGDGIDPDPEETVGGSDPAAVNYHGSHVAGTVAAAGNNGVGVAGVAYGARVMPLRAITATGGTSYDVRQAVRFAAGLENDSGTVPERAADIVNLSLGGAGFSSLDQALYDELRERGIAVVAAAGNEGSRQASFPAGYGNVLGVSAVDSQREITAYSNRGAAVDVTAPGGDGSRDLNGDGYPDGVLSTGAADGDFAYTFLSGTSMAAPHVAGVLALMKSVNPQLDAEDMERLLVAGSLTTDLGDPGRDDLFGHGLIDARRALDAALIEAGEDIDTPARLASSTSALNFGTARDSLEFSLLNSGSNALTVSAVESDEPWLAVSALDTDSAGLGRYRVAVDRSGLAPGVYEGRITARSTSNDLSVRALLSIAQDGAAELGTLYLLVYDPETDEIVAQAALRNAAFGYQFNLPEVPVGEYQIYAGTDLDNDLVICDPGEACGAYLTIESPLTISVDADREDISFPIEYLIALPGAADLHSGRSLRILERDP